jgi:aspartyl-tRNA(Asn)/glutamyl-tRNA(Gln) amidotransferase subunit B
MVSVEGTLNDCAFRGTFEPDGEGGHWLKVERKLREAAGVGAGETVKLEVVPMAAGEAPEPEVPPDFRKALAAASVPGAREAWKEITPAARRDWIHWITSGKRAETRAIRIEKALAVEIRRQNEVVARGEKVEHMTLLWDEARGDVRPMRSKEESHDYRYFPDPDLPPLLISADRIEEIRAELPELPAAMRIRFGTEYGLSAYEGEVLTATSSVARFYEAVVAATGDPKQASNWVMGPVLALAKEKGIDPKQFEVDFPLSPSALGELIGLIQLGKISQSVGKTVLLRMADTGRRAAEIVEAEGLTQVSDPGELERWIDGVIAAHPDEVSRFRDGEKKLQGFFMGEIMKASRGKADPGEVSRLLGRKLAG